MMVKKLLTGSLIMTKFASLYLHFCLKKSLSLSPVRNAVGDWA